LRLNQAALSFKTLWADNGDNLSKAYAGTAALKSTFTRTGKNTTMGLVTDGIKSVSRSFIQNFYVSIEMEHSMNERGSIKSQKG
jgi:hypothetical protein